MHSCSLVQASTQMPTSLVVAAYERRCVRSTLERERRAASHQCAAREPPGPESRRGTMEHAQESTLADRRPQSGRQERAGDGRSKRPPSQAEGKNLCRKGLWIRGSSENRSMEDTKRRRSNERPGASQRNSRLRSVTVVADSPLRAICGGSRAIGMYLCNCAFALSRLMEQSHGPPALKGGRARCGRRWLPAIRLGSARACL